MVIIMYPLQQIYLFSPRKSSKVQIILYLRSQNKTETSKETNKNTVSCAASKMREVSTKKEKWK